MPPIITPQTYVANRQNYSYQDPNVEFSIHQTGNLPYTGTFHGIFPRTIPHSHPNGVNLRKFEQICQTVFQDAQLSYKNEEDGSLTHHQLDNIRAVILAIVHWKMASQGGRSAINVENVAGKWIPNRTPFILLNAYKNRSLCQFKIDGVRIPTASAFLRFLDPDMFGIIDSRVVNNYTQPVGITTLNIRNDGYINDVKHNDACYQIEYLPFLRSEAAFLNGNDKTFNDVDANGLLVISHFRACDVEMALF
jgi:hypothetical protein